MAAMVIVILAAAGLGTWWAEWRQSDRETARREVNYLADRGAPRLGRNPCRWLQKKPLGHWHAPKGRDLETKSL